MIVYGDPHFITTLNAFTKRLSALLDMVAALSPSPRHGANAVDTARHFLIACGQCEQALEDSFAPLDFASPLKDSLHGACLAIRLATDAAAEILLDVHQDQWDDFADHAERCRAALDALALCAINPSLTVKLPEGYDFYLLFPEQYLLAARHWLDYHKTTAVKSANVVGLRSIGTSLSALVAAMLRRSGQIEVVRRVTVRPYGPPFERRVTLPDALLDDQPGERDFALVVDEGPGLSGSSMAAAYTALVEAGYAPNRIALFPGHGGLPGGEGGEQVKRIWAAAQRYVGSRTELRWSGATLQERLVEASRKLAEFLPGNADAAPEHPLGCELHDLGSGAWRSFAYGPSDSRSWPPVSPQFERPKFLWRPGAANQGGILWTYVGLSEILNADGCLASRETAAAERLDALANFTEPAWGKVSGFIATPWVDGKLLRAEAAQDADLLPLLAIYCRAASLPPLPDDDSQAAWHRLSEMLYWNTRELLGDLAADRASRLARDAAGERIHPVASYGDGRMAPHKWVRRPDGTIRKTDCVGHDFDHTAVGRQPIWWDAAGVSVEWKLPSRLRVEFWEAVQEQLGTPSERRVAADSASARFYQSAYAAFRIGILTLSAGAASDSEEWERCNLAVNDYRIELIASLQL